MTSWQFLPAKPAPLGTVWSGRSSRGFVLRQNRLVISQLCLYLASASLSLSLSFLMCPGSDAPTPGTFKGCVL